MSKREQYVMVDTEYSGDCPGDYSLLSIGAVVVGKHTPPFHRSFYRELMPLPGAKFDPEAMAVNKLDPARLAIDGQPAPLAIRDFSRWVLSGVEDDEYPVMVADGQHDFMYMRWHFAHFGIRNPFYTAGYNPAAHGIDMKSMLMGMHPHLTLSKTRRSSVIAEFPEYRSRYDRTHGALDDAIEQAERFTRMLQKRA